MERILFGTAGVPKSTVKNSPVDGIKRVHELGLDCMQLEFSHGMRMKDEMSATLRRLSYELNIPLTSHGPYYINLNAKEQDKIDASIERIIQTAKVSDVCGAESMTFHAAFYMKDSPYDVFDLVEKSMNVIEERLSMLDIEIDLRPELTGKKSQFGSLDELVNLSHKVGSCKPCIDFSQLYARTGECNTYEEFLDTLNNIESELGTDSLKQMHLHVSGVATTPKGDLKRLDLEESDFNWKDMLKALKEKNCRGYLISHSPNKLEDDALMMKEYYLAL